MTLNKNISKRISGWLSYFLLLLVIIFIVALLAVRFLLFPNIDAYKNDIAAYASKVAQQKISIGNIYTSWDGFSPHIALFDVDLYDAQNRAALKLPNVEATLSWISVPLLRPKLANLLVNSPVLTIRRMPNGHIFLAGIPLGDASKPDFPNWLLSQSQLTIKNAQVIWQDELRQAPPLALNQVNLMLSNPAFQSLFGRHTFTLSALPSVGSNQAITASGHFIGRDVTQLMQWQGSVSTKLTKAELSVWKPWADYTILNQTLDVQSGVGDATISLDFGNARIEKTAIKANVSNLSIANINAATGKPNAPFIAKTFSGDLDWSDFKQTQTIRADHIMLTTNTGFSINNGNGYYSTSLKNGKPWVRSDIKLDALNLAAINQLTPYLRLPEITLAWLNSLAPTGELQAPHLHWEGAGNKPSQYQFATVFKQLSISPTNKIPGFKNLTGTLNTNEKGGQVILQSQNALLEFKDILRWPVPADKLNGEINWAIKDGKTLVSAKELFITSPHITGTVNASVDINNVKGGRLDLRGKFSKGNAKFAPFYYPLILGAPTIHWLDTTILAGRVEDVNVTVNGNLDDFPFVNSKNQLDKNIGVFRVTAKISDALLEYGTGWPEIEGLGLDLLFEGKRMELNANKGHIYGNKIISSKTEIPQLDADSPMLIITSEVDSPAPDGIKFVNQSPVKLVTQGFTDDLKTAGNGRLSLLLKIPMKHLEKSQYKGSYKINNGTIFANPDISLPELAKLNGTLNFTENSLSAQNISTEVLGNAALFSLKTGADKALIINANGRISDANIKKLTINPLTESMQGNADWAGEISIKKPLVNMSVRSNLLGMAINLPAPFNKPANQEIALSLEKKQLNPTSDSVQINYGDAINAKIMRTEQAGKLAFERGDIGIGTTAVLPTQAGISLHGKLDYLNADDWVALFNKPRAAKTNAPLLINKTELAVQKLDLYGRRLTALTVLAEPSATGLKMVIDSQEITGDAEWQSAGNGKIIARLKNLTIANNDDAAKKIEPKSAPNKDFKKLGREYPALDVTAENFQIGNKKLGALELNAFETGDDWTIQKLKIINPDSTLSAVGSWHNWTRGPNTNLKFVLSTNNIGNTLKRFGQPDVVKGGDAEVTGQLQWPGSPHQFDTDGLSGNVKLEATKGQFLKVDPSVGRLLGLLSLQSLPRRLSLDFRDLFSDGFAFDKITASAKIDQGILRSNDFLMDGPAAEAKIKGETNLKTKTQNLKIKVRPHISDSLSLAAFAGGPIAGVAAFVAQKLLKDPFNKIIQSEYVITGTWDKPVEVESEKSEAQKPSNKSPLHP
ncbi:MAG: TIGR02099 family protein [Bdellovibrio sp.]|nr:TIGR02099 family protein [Methylotenera sp.]